MNRHIETAPVSEGRCAATEARSLSRFPTCRGNPYGRAQSNSSAGIHAVHPIIISATSIISSLLLGNRDARSNTPSPARCQE